MINMTLANRWTALLIFLTVVAIIAVIYTLVLFLYWPLGALLNRLLNRSENSTVAPAGSFVLGKLTLGITPEHEGEVMVTGGGRARQTYIAKMYEDAKPDLPKGSDVVVVEVKTGTAYVLPVSSERLL